MTPHVQIDGADRGWRDAQPVGEAPVATADAVSVFAPWCDETERGLRIRIHRARDSATARATRCKHGDARTIYWIAAQQASARVFARMPNDELKEAIDNLARLFLVAGWIERTELHDVE